VVLQRSKRGFGFVLRGAKAASPLMQLKPSLRCPALQYLDDVDPGGVADLANLRKGDFLLSVSSLTLVFFSLRNETRCHNATTYNFR
jgi:SH3/ankyrin repeat-containing protein